MGEQQFAVATSTDRPPRGTLTQPASPLSRKTGPAERTPHRRGGGAGGGGTTITRCHNCGSS
ncbi:MAG: hypothetical protein ACKOJF_20585, partial [Planctomycetaceae bacterium]